MAFAGAWRRGVILLGIVVGLAVVGLAWRLLFAPQPEPGRFAFPAAAARHSWQGHKGYLATIDSAALCATVIQSF